MRNFFCVIKSICAGSIVLLLVACGKSEVDKCVDAFMTRYDAMCASKQLAIKDCTQPGLREQEEANSRLQCLSAAGGKK